MTLLIDKIAAIFERARNKQAFPGGVVWLDNNNAHLHKSFGRIAYNDEDCNFVQNNFREKMLFDMASITKLFTATAVLMSAEKHGISLDTEIATFLPAFAKGDHQKITLRNLLLHNSGIGIAIQSLKNEDCDDWISLVAAAPLHAAVGEKVRYSCTNFFLLARIAELWNESPIDEWITAHLLRPLRMERSTYTPKKYFSLDEIVPTEIDSATNKPWRGVVHDEAARAWQQQTQTNCGNSGLFSTAADMAKLVKLWQQRGTLDGKKYFSAEIAREALTPQAVEMQQQNETEILAQRGLGWQINARFFMGHKAPEGSAGHTGFTGPSLFFTPQGACVIILENRVYPTRNGPDRFMFHRRIAQALLSA